MSGFGINHCAGVYIYKRRGSNPKAGDSRKPQTTVTRSNKKIPKKRYPTTITTISTMHLFWLPLLLLAATGLAETVGYWTLHNFELICEPDGYVCVYKFSITEDPSTDPGDQTTQSGDSTQCVFTVQDPGQNANRTDWQNADCTPDNQNYQSNGGWSDQGFLTVVVTNHQENSFAFFAFDQHALEGEQTVDEQTRMAYRIGTFEAVAARQDRADVVGDETVAARQDRGW
jgi:hypothetical protein